MRTRAELRKTIYNEFKDILDSTNELLRIAEEMMDEMNQKGVLKTKSQNHEKASGILFREAYSRFPAVKLLCEDGMGDTSLIVLRSQLNLFIMFHWILKKQKEARAKRYIGWYWKTWKEKITQNPSAYDVQRKRSVRDNYNAVRHLYAYRVKDKLTGKYKRKQAKVWYLPETIETMAQDIGLKRHYEDGYRVLSWVEHIDPTHVLLKAKNGKLRGDPGFDKPILNESLVMNFSYFRSICTKVNKVFFLGKDKILRELANQERSFKRSDG